jgi:hypothetical protein
MTNYKNNLPPYVEEQVINEEAINIQKILNKFDQLVPKGFTELGQPKNIEVPLRDWISHFVNATLLNIMVN